MLIQSTVKERPVLKTVHINHNNKSFDNKLNLTTRETEVLELICLGMTMKEIAGKLFLSESTIISHKRNLLTKFRAKNLVRLAVLAERMKLTVG